MHARDVCDGDNTSCSDCAGTPNGSATTDNCGTCDGDSANDCVQDCAGTWGGSLVESDFYLDGDGDGLGSGASVTICGTPPSGWVSNADDTDDFCFSNSHDCAGVCDGTAVIDDCGVCDGGNADQDCTGECFGEALIDDCGVCEGGKGGQ